MSAELQFVDVSPTGVRTAEKQCRRAGKEYFGQYLWALANLPAKERSAMDALLFLIREGVTRVLQFHQMNPANVSVSMRCDFANELRDKLNACLVGKYTSAAWALVRRMKEEYQIPREFLFEFTEGINHEIRFGQPKNFEDMRIRTTRLGGAPLAAAVKIMGVHGDFHVPALRCGQALLMSHWLCELKKDAEKGFMHFPYDDHESTGCHREQLMAAHPSPQITHFVRLQAHRINLLFHAAKPLIPLLDYDCSRVIRALISATWQINVRLQHSPDLLLSPEGVVTPKTVSSNRIRYLLGLDGPLPFELDPIHNSH